MIGFKDKLGRQWICRVDIAAIRRVRALCSIDLANSVRVHPDGKTDTDVLLQIAEDPCLLVDVIFAVCKEQAEQQNITDVQFAEGFDGETLDAATMALMEGIIEFFPLAKRRLLTRILEQVKRQRQQGIEKLEEMEKDGTLDRLIGSAMDRSQDSSPPAPERSE